MPYRFMLILLTLICGGGLSAQQLWPGDVTDNGVVDVVDVLYWGLAEGATGPARAQEDTEWMAQAAPAPWALTFPNGVNYAYADCNGDGIVNDDDLDEAIRENYGLTQGMLVPDTFATAPVGAVAPRLVLVPDATLVEEGAVITIDLFLDDADAPVDSFQGMALKMSYTPELLADDDGPDFDLTEDGWLEGNDGNGSIKSFLVENDDLGKTDLAITRKGDSPVAVGEEAIGSFTVVIEDIIIGLAVDTFILTIDSVLLLTEDFGTMAVAPASVRVLVAKDSSLVVGNQEFNDDALRRVNVYPNPSNGEFILESSAPFLRISLHDVFGHALPLTSYPFSQNRSRIQVRHYRPGVHWLRLSTPDGVISRKLIFTHNPKTF